MPAARTNKTRHLILGLLSEGPLSGYEIRRLTRARFRFFWSESFGQLYPELARLEREGLAVREAAPRRGRRRNEYRITPAGSRTLQNWLGEPVEAEAVRQEILLKVYFSALVDRSVLVRHVSEFRERHGTALAELEAFREQLSTAPDPSGNHDRVLMSIDFGVRTFRAYTEWADAILASGLHKRRRAVGKGPTKSGK